MKPLGGIMNRYTEEQLTRFMGILKALKLTKEEIFGICTFMKTEEMMMEVLEEMEKKDFKLTKQEIMNIVGEVVKKH